MSSEPPKPGSIPGWGQPPDATPTEPVPAPSAPAAAPGATPGWGQPPAPAPEPAAPAAPAPGWGQPAAPAGAPAPAAEPAAPAPGWGQPAGQTPPPQQPPAQQPPAPQAPAPQAPPPGAWGAPPAAGMAAGGAGAPPNWAAQGPAPAPSSGNGCLKACLIVGVILVILFGIALAGLWFLGNQVVKSLPIDSEGNLQECTIISNEKLSSVLGSGTEAIPLEGIFDTLLGLVLDKRVLADATDCFISADQGSTGTGGSPATTAAMQRRSSPRRSRRPARVRGPGWRRHARERGLLRRRRLGSRRRGVLHGRARTRRCRGCLVRAGRHARVRSAARAPRSRHRATEPASIWSPETCAEGQQVARATSATRPYRRGRRPQRADPPKRRGRGPAARAGPEPRARARRAACRS